MRQIATLPPDQAELIADHLLTLHVDTKLERLGPEVVVWVCDEDKVAGARLEVEKFRQELERCASSPSDPRLTQVRQRAAQIRREREEEDEGEAEDAEETRPEADAVPADARRPVTLALMAASAMVFANAAAGDPERGYDPGPVYRALMINSPETAKDGVFADVRAGQTWRLFTPALLHFGWAHVLPNLIMLLYLGTQVEARAGPIRMLLLTLVLAAASNAAEYLLGHVAWGEGVLTLTPYINFGGLSGVLFGLVGYWWVKGGRGGADWPAIPPPVLVISLFWLVLCWAGVMGPVANVAHTAGLLAGMALACIPSPRLQPAPGPTPEDEPR
jgi:GlpG protein